MCISICLHATALHTAYTHMAQYAASVLHHATTTTRASHITQHHTSTISVLLQSLMATTASQDTHQASQLTTTASQVQVSQVRESQVQASQDTVQHLANSLY